MYSIDSAVKYSFWKNKANLTLRVSDVLNTRQFNIYTSDDITFEQTSLRKRQSRFYYIGFNYRFGNMKVGDDRRRKRDGGGDGGFDDGGGLM